MTTDIHLSSGIDDTPELREHIERRLGFALGRFGDKVTRVSVHLVDQNGPKGGVDIRCKIQVHLHPHGTLLIEQDEANPEHAVEVASIRLGQAIRRELDRQRSSRTILAQ
jgi:putative sigma-54 modulation protein